MISISQLPEADNSADTKTKECNKYITLEFYLSASAPMINPHVPSAAGLVHGKGNKAADPLEVLKV